MPRPTDQMFYGFFEEGQEKPVYDPHEKYGPVLCPYCGKLLLPDDVRTHSLMFTAPAYAKRSYFYRTHRTCDDKSKASSDPVWAGMDDFILDMITRNGD